MTGADHPLTIDVGPAALTVVPPARQPREVEGRLTFWWGVTTSAVALARVLATGPRRSGLRAVELGCGCGLAGIAAAWRGAHVRFTDVVPEALARALAGAEASGIPADRVDATLLDWGDPAGLEPADVVLGAEILYDYWFHDDLLRLLDAAVAPGGTILLADRPRLVVERALGRLRGRGFDARWTDHRVDEPGLPVQDVRVYELRR